MSTAKNVIHEIEDEAEIAAVAADRIAKISLETIASLQTVPAYLILFSTVIIGLLGVGITLIIIRVAFLWMIPQLISVSGVVAFGVNWAIDALEIFEVIVSDTVDVILDIIDIITFSKPDHIVSASIKWSDISASQIRTFLSTVSTSCTPYDSIVPIFNATIKLVASQTVCPIIRSVQPMPVISTVANVLLGWMSYEWNPNPGQNNCRSSHEQANIILCTTFGAGYIILELLLPMLIGAILLVSMGSSVFRLISTIVVYAIEITFDAFKDVIKIFS